MPARHEHQIVEHLHRGPKTEVYRAKTPSEYPVIVKTFQRGDGEEAAQRCRREFEILERLASVPGVVHLRLSDVPRDDLSLTLEDTGSALGTILAARQLSLMEALRIGLGVANVLARIHDAEVVHNDINPWNITITEALETTLIDFDLAFVLERGSVRPASTSAAGTLAYLAPEQTGRVNRSIDHRADLYALGVTLYEMLAGRRPFSGESALEVIHRHLAHPPPPLDSSVPSIVARIVYKLLEKDPDL